jgi:hypothetical protein
MKLCHDHGKSLPMMLFNPMTKRQKRSKEADPALLIVLFCSFAPENN